MQFAFSGELWLWRGPAPWHFVGVPPDECAAIRSIAAGVTYGWGMIPATVTVGKSEWTTALWPKDGGYIVPIKKWVQVAEELDVGDTINVNLEV